MTGHDKTVGWTDDMTGQDGRQDRGHDKTDQRTGQGTWDRKDRDGTREMTGQRTGQDRGHDRIELDKTGQGTGHGTEDRQDHGHLYPTKCHVLYRMKLQKCKSIKLQRDANIILRCYNMI